MSQPVTGADTEPRPPAPHGPEGAKRRLGELLRTLPNLVKLIGRLAVHPDVPAREKAILAATIAYVATPIDFVPDFVPFVGQVDDIFLIALALRRLISVAGEELVLKNWDGDPKLLSIIQQVLEVTTFFLPKPLREKLVGRVSG